MISSFPLIITKSSQTWQVKSGLIALHIVGVWVLIGNRHHLRLIWRKKYERSQAAKEVSHLFLRWDINCTHAFNTFVFPMITQFSIKEVDYGHF